jgi:uncharacterized protein YecE (DUF72 family)
MARAQRGTIRIGIAGWSLRREHVEFFPAGGSHLQRYAAAFDCVEINSSFHRPHRPATYARWAASVPADFRFAVKLPKEITHTRRLVDVAEPLQRFLSEASHLGDRLGPILVQLPGSFAFDARIVGTFFARLRQDFDGLVGCEPRHASWFTDKADRLMVKHRVARVAADPALSSRAAEPGGWDGFGYWRLHGSPRMYYSSYPLDWLAGLTEQLIVRQRPIWCIVDNTALGAAISNAVAVLRGLEAHEDGRQS